MFYLSRDTLHGRRISTLENDISGHCVCSDNAKIWQLPTQEEPKNLSVHPTLVNATILNQVLLQKRVVLVEQLS